MTRVFVICPFHSVELNEASLFLTSSNFVQMWLKLELEICLFREILPHIFFFLQTKWTKNTDEPKIYLISFSSKLWRGQFALKFFTQNIWKENITKYLCVISTDFQFKIICMSTTVPSSSCLAKDQ